MDRTTKKELHVKLPADEHQKFMYKVRNEEDSNASRKIRGWIRKFLKGEIA